MDPPLYPYGKTAGRRLKQDLSFILHIASPRWKRAKNLPLLPSEGPIDAQLLHRMYTSCLSQQHQIQQSEFKSSRFEVV